MRRIVILVIAGAFAAGLATAAQAMRDVRDTAPTASAAAIKINVLSNRADLISGGDALVAIAPVDATSAKKLQVTLNGRDVTSAFALRPDGRFEGLVTGLRVGDNVLAARQPGGKAQITITNHSINGPVISGPQALPWFCGTSATLGPLTPPNCWAPTKYTFLYKSTNPTKSGFQPYDPAHPPSDVAMTTTQTGSTVPYIVREEEGVLNRAIYDIDVLFDPTKPWAPWAPQPAWNGKLLINFQGGAAQLHQQGNPETGSTRDDYALSRGFLTGMTSLNRGGTNDNDITQAESIIMLKERIVESYGPLRYTIGAGCSEGSIQQALLASNYPGLLQGLQPKCSYPDILGTAIEAFDCSLVINYLENTSPELWGSVALESAVMDQPGGTCHSWRDVFGLSFSWFDPTKGCYYGTVAPVSPGPPPPWVWTPDNPTGARCALHDYLGNVFPRRTDGYIGRPFDNVGLQYGLKALLAGKITPVQFIDLNAKIGGIDINGQYVPERTVADPGAAETAYRTGQISDPRQLANVPMIDLRGSDNAEIHANMRTYQARERLVKANGTAANQVLWTDGCALVGCPTDPVGAAGGALLLIDEWIQNIQNDQSNLPLPAKVIANKPAAAIDQCWIGGQSITDLGVCQAAYPYYGTPRTGAGGPLSEDILKCQLKPLNRTDYRDAAVPFTDAQWAQMQAIFPDGVCDWTKPGVGYQPAIPWMTYDVIGGRPLGPAPQSTP